MLREASWALTAAALLLACGSSDSSGGGGGTGGTHSGGTGGSTTGGTGGATGGTGGATGGTGGATGGTGGATGGTGGATGGAAGAATGGAAGTATGGAAGASGGTGGTGGGQACTWGSGAACPSGQYCDAPGCGAGKCAPIPAETDTQSPVCGCDGVTYWNSSVAGHASMSVKGSGECTTGAKTCGGIAGLKCPTGTDCNYQINNAAMCNASDQAGTCWGLPAKCPTILIGPQTRACKATTCTAECDLIKSGKVWYPDNTCPT